MYKLVLVMLMVLTCTADAGWQRVATMNAPVGCGYMLDEKTILLGSGAFGGAGNIPPYTLRIWRSTDGGTTWQQMQTPDGTGRITHITFLTDKIGYASLYSIEYSLWKTTDGGLTWNDHTFGNNILSTCIGVTTKAIVKSHWSGRGGSINSSGGISTNDGRTMQLIFDNFGETALNGIAFSDDNRGVVVAGPQSLNRSYYTIDGGLTFQRGGVIQESWGVYALQGTSTFIALPEGLSTTPQRSVVRTDNIGQSWNTIFTFQNGINFTGHIDGMGSTVYVQTTATGSSTSGLYRSDNLGASWKNVGGPSYQRDTRFVVGGCRGEVVFAFDNNGNVWRTTDGGDGTLTRTIANPGAVILEPDTVRIHTFYCQPELGSFTIKLPPCARLQIDSVMVIGGNGEFSTAAGSFSITEPDTTTVTVKFRADIPVTRIAKVRLVGIIGGMKVDTFVTVIGKNATAPEPSIGSIASRPAGDTAIIPVYLTPTQDTFTIKKYALHISYNTDMMSPLFEDVVGTLSLPNDNSLLREEKGGLYFECTLRNVITERTDLTVPLIKFAMQTYLSKDITTQVRLDTFSVTSLAPLPLCTIPQEVYSVIYECGDTLLTALMKNGKIPFIYSIRPNPAQTGTVTVGLSIPETMTASLEVCDQRGTVVYRSAEKEYHKGEIDEPLSPELGSGSYFIRLRSMNKTYPAAKLLVRK